MSCLIALVDCDYGLIVMVFTPSWLLNIVMMASCIVSNEPPIAADASLWFIFEMCSINIFSTNPEWFLYHIEVAKLVATLIITFLCALFFCTAIWFMLIITDITDCIVTHSVIPIGVGTHVNDIINWKNAIPLVEFNGTPFPVSPWQLSFFFLCDRELNDDHQLCYTPYP